MDTSKVTAMLATNPGKPRDYASWPHQEPPLFKNHPLPLIAIPTTAGTGSEMDHWAGIIDSTDSIKMDLGQPPAYPGGPYLGASIALVDPNLTLTLPQVQTATTGMDALLHAIGAYTANCSFPHVSALAEHVIKLIAKNLPIAYADGNNIEARKNMMLAANLAGICINWVPVIGADHALSLAVVDLYPNTIHGMICSIFAPAAIEFNRIAAPSKYAKIASLMGEEIDGLSIRDAALKARGAIKKLMQDLDLPNNLKSVGIKKDHISALAKKASQKVDIEGNPRLIKYENLLKIIKRVYAE